MAMVERNLTSCSCHHQCQVGVLLKATITLYNDSPHNISDLKRHGQQTFPEHRNKHTRNMRQIDGCKLPFTYTTNFLGECFT